MDGGPGAGSPPPVGVRAAGVGVVVEGLALFAFGLYSLITLAAGFGLWGFFLLAGGGLIAIGVALVAGRRGARAPAVVMQILLLGVAYYALVGSAQPVVGVPLALLAAAVMAGVLSRPARAWADE